MSRTKAVGGAIRGLRVQLANVAASQAIFEAKQDRVASAERLVGVTGRWLDNAGAHATKWHFREPRV